MIIHTNNTNTLSIDDGNVSNDGEYRYRSATDCIGSNLIIDYGYPITTSNMATEIKYVEQAVVGIAKDGRVIYGPIKEQASDIVNTLYDACDLDICNGM